MLPHFLTHSKLNILIKYQLIHFLKRFFCEVFVESPNGLRSDILILRIKQYKLLLICLYHPYWGKCKAHETLLQFLNEIIDAQLKDNEVLLISGDINDLRFHIDSFLISNNLRQIVTVPTRKEQTLDVIYVPCQLQMDFVIESFAPLGRSDHNVILTKPKQVSKINKKVFIRDYSAQNKCLFKDCLSDVVWCQLFQNKNSTNDLEEIFDQTLTKIFNYSFPLKSVSLSNKDQPWITPRIKLLMQEKDRALHRGRRHKYISIRERLAKEIQSSKSKYYASASNEKPKKLWSKINYLIKPKVLSKTFTQEKIDEINNIFSKVFEPESITKFARQSAKYQQQVEIEELEVYNVMMSIKSNACGPDGIPGFIYRDFSFILAKPLCFIINKSFQQSIVPDNWKKAHIIPLPKDKTNFRPISLLPYPSKVLEKLFIKFYLLQQTEPHFNHHQFAFIPHKNLGTSNALTVFRLHVLNCITAFPSYVRCIAVDFLKAFDKISHEIILKTAQNDFFLPNHTVNWLYSFLSNRSQRVHISNSLFTSWKSCSSGVPQGSILGPLLFAMVINSYGTVSQRSKFILYADDLTILHHVPMGMTDESQLEMDNLIMWAHSTKLFINSSKSYVINFNPHKLPLPNLSLHQQQIVSTT